MLVRGAFRISSELKSQPLNEKDIDGHRINCTSNAMMMKLQQGLFVLHLYCICHFENLVDESVSDPFLCICQCQPETVRRSLHGLHTRAKRPEQHWKCVSQNWILTS